MTAPPDVFDRWWRAILAALEAWAKRHKPPKPHKDKITRIDFTLC